MRLLKAKKSKGIYYTIVEDMNKDGKRSTWTLENLGYLENIEDPVEKEKYAVKRYEALKAERDLELQSRKTIITLDSTLLAQDDSRRLINIAPVYLQPICKALGFKEICDDIASRYKFEYNLSGIMTDLVVSRILNPNSKAKTFDELENYFNSSDFDQHHIYRALQVLSKETDFIQEKLYKYSLNITNRKDRVLYYDCTNFFYEIDNEDITIDENNVVTKGLRTKGHNKDGSHKPIVQMGLFMDGDGLPLAFNITSGCTNEQITLRPTLQKIIQKYGLEKIVVCTDAGLGSLDNRAFNSVGKRAFITTIPVTRLKDEERWALNKDGWRISGDPSGKLHNIEKLISLAHDNPELVKNHSQYETVFYKKCEVNNPKIDSSQFYVVTFSLKYAALKRKSNLKLEKVLNAICSNPNQNKKTLKKGVKSLLNENIIDNVTGEIDKNASVKYTRNEEAIKELDKYNGFYVVATNLDDTIEDIVSISKRRWEIEESFRIMKTSFESRPVYVSSEECIRGHFLTCYMALLVYRMLEKITDCKFTTDNIIDSLRSMYMLNINNGSYVPAYRTNEFYETLYKKFDFRTDYQIMSEAKLKQLCKSKKFIKIHKDSEFEKRKMATKQVISRNK